MPLHGPDAPREIKPRHRRPGRGAGTVGSASASAAPAIRAAHLRDPYPAFVVTLPGKWLDPVGTEFEPVSAALWKRRAFRRRTKQTDLSEEHIGPLRRRIGNSFPKPER